MLALPVVSLRVATETPICDGGIRPLPGASKSILSVRNGSLPVGCHKWHGNGGGYGGDALSLRHTQLTREQIVTVCQPADIASLLTLPAC